MNRSKVKSNLWPSQAKSTRVEKRARTHTHTHTNTAYTESKRTHNRTYVVDNLDRYIEGEGETEKKNVRVRERKIECVCVCVREREI